MDHDAAGVGGIARQRYSALEAALARVRGERGSRGDEESGRAGGVVHGELEPSNWQMPGERGKRRLRQRQLGVGVAELLDQVGEQRVQAIELCNDIALAVQRHIVIMDRISDTRSKEIEYLRVGPAIARGTDMPYVITDPCVGTCDTACVSVCPVDCIHGPVSVQEIELVPREERRRRFPTMQLYIDPDACICCAACVPECPVEAIFDVDDVPEAFRGSIEANAAFFRSRAPSRAQGH